MFNLFCISCGLTMASLQKFLGGSLQKNPVFSKLLKVIALCMTKGNNSCFILLLIFQRGLIFAYNTNVEIFGIRNNLHELNEDTPKILNFFVRNCIKNHPSHIWPHLVTCGVVSPETSLGGEVFRGTNTNY